jgi:hypothetical protein
MIEIEDDKMVEIEYEMTVPTEAYGNLKPKLKMKCKINEVEQSLLLLRSRLKAEYIKIKEAKNGPQRV